MITRTLGGAEAALEDVAKQARSRALDIDDPRSVERSLFAVLLGNDDLSEVTFTGARKIADHPEPRFAALGRWQISVYRDGTEPAGITSCYSHQEGRKRVVDLRRRPPGSIAFEAMPFTRSGVDGLDPTEHPTFTTPVSLRGQSGLPVWTDLHYAELDAGLPEAKQRVVVTVMKVLNDESGQFMGVIRVGLLVSRLEEVTRLRVDDKDPHDPHRVFVADGKGRLILRMRPDQRYEDQDGDVRPAEGLVPEELRVALAHPALAGVSAEHPEASGRFAVGGRTFLLSALALVGAQDWRVGIVVPEDHYLGDLERIRRVLIGVSVVALAISLALFGGTLRSVQRSLGRMVSSAARMRDFDFAPSPAVSPFGDVREVMEDLEQAKTALRAMGKYVPIGLVRRLYRTRQEPMLGGELRDLTMMFTDVQDFTTLSERLAPDVLARALGRYFEVMTTAIHATGGTIDKYIGDAVMALWNAPDPRPDHAVHACEAALSCLGATRALMNGPDWEGLPVFRTRFGLHRQEVMVGHFGAPDRISYTALGDGVNLASRLEGLNKAYGTTILASQAVRDSVGSAFSFRLVDVVAVKGKSQGVRVFELLGRGTVALSEEMSRYEQAFDAYEQRRFAEALELLGLQPDDPPSRVLAERCLGFLDTPPPDDWQGVYISHEK
jgi:adenylate cyclase